MIYTVDITSNRMKSFVKLSSKRQVENNFFYLLNNDRKPTDFLSCAADTSSILPQPVCHCFQEIFVVLCEAEVVV